MNKELDGYALSVFKPRRKETVTQWAERELVIPQGPYAGSPFRVRNAPYMEFILELVKNPKAKKISCKFATQLGKSLMMLVSISWIIANDPSTILYIADNATNGKSVSKNQFQPMLATSPELAELLPQERYDEKITNLEMAFENSALFYIVGAQSSSSLSGKAIKYLFADEIRSYKTGGGDSKEADSLSLALNRTKSFNNSKVFLSSSPTVAGEGISKHHIDGSCHELNVPCPHCGHKQKLEFDQLKWEGRRADKSWNKNEVKKTVRYQCKSCKTPINEGHKTAMLRGGEWVQTNLDALDGDYSFQLSSLYSLQLSWADIVIKFLESKDSPSGLQDFKQNYLAEDFVHYSEQIKTTSSLDKLKADYQLETLQTGQVLMAVDVQLQILKFSVRQFSGEKSFLIDRGECISWDTIREIEKKYGVEAVICDSGHRTTQVYEEVFKSKNWVACKGAPSKNNPAPFVLVPNFDPFSGSRNQGRYSVRLLHVNTNLWQSNLQECLGGDKNWFLPKYIDEDYLQELLNEIPVEVENKNGSKRTEWRKIGTNDFRDIERYLLAFHAFLNPKPKSVIDTPRRQRFTGFSL